MQNKTNLNQKDINAGGDVIQKNYIGIQPSSKQTRFYDFLKAFMSYDFSGSEMDIDQAPATLNQKLIYNNAQRYISIFSMRAHDSVIIDNIITNDLANGQRVIDRLRGMFYTYVDIDKNGIPLPSNGEEVIKKLIRELHTIILADQRFNGEKEDDEFILQFSYAFLSYGVSKCQVLLNPNKEE